MNRKQLRKLGVPEFCLNTAVTAVQQAAAADNIRGRALKERVVEVLDNPTMFVGDSPFSPLAQELLEDDEPMEPAEPVSYRTWGEDIDVGAHDQMRQACAVPSAVGAALMPDAHIGYGLPIGGVLALENAVIPYAVGVDIACRMKLTVIDMPVETLGKNFEQYKDSLMRGTRFGIGCKHEKPQEHPVMDQDWTVSRITRMNKDKARKQLGTSGSGNHFAEFGKLTLTERADDLNLDAGEYVALLSHSGSRGTGASVCDTYSNIARSMLPRRYASKFGRLGWLDMDSQEGQEYWAAMNLMGDYASANHDVLHRLVLKNLGARVVSQVENHHNFAWLENHNGRDVVVHRKGATPASKGALGVIPGSMADPAFVVRGKGEPNSLCSASHGAGRRMSRRKAKDKYNFNAVRKDLEKKGVRVLAAGADEVPGVYKDIHEVMAAQKDLVDIVARFDPKIVRMCGDGSRAED
ncbi:MAG: RtcB family protein [Planctomycetaceae bacterium]